MKKFFLLLVLLLSVSPAWALYCQNCGYSMEEEARFCAQCGSQKAGLVGAPTISPAQAPVLVSEVPAGAYLVNSPSLQVGGYRLQRGHPIYVLEMGEGRVRIRFRYPDSCSNGIVAWVPISDLECHTGWRRPYYPPPVIACGPSRVTTRIVFGGGSFCWPFQVHRRSDHGHGHGYGHSRPSGGGHHGRH